MKNSIKILHLNKRQEVDYFIIRKGIFIRSTVPRKNLRGLLKSGELDLILAEPHEVVLLKPWLSRLTSSLSPS